MTARVLSGPAPNLLVAALLGVAAFVETAFGAAETEVTAAAALGALALAVSVALTYWTPLGGMALLVAALAVPAVFDELPARGGAYLITLMVLVAYAAYRLPPRRSAWAYVMASVIVAGTLVLAGEELWEFLFFALILGPAWLLGWLLRREQHRSAELARLAEALRMERERQAEVAVTAERTRISRELHDAVAHTVSVMTLQVGVVRRRAADLPPAEEATLRNAEELGRQAVDELRRIVGILNEGEAPALAPLPSLADLDALVEHVRSTGTRVEIAVEGDLTDLPSAVDMSAYRILQESLTNALRHAPGAPVALEVRAGRDEVRLAVVNGAPTRPATPLRPGGRGDAGMRERAAMLGGSLESGPSGAGYAVRARLPVIAPRGRAASPELSTLSSVEESA